MFISADVPQDGIAQQYDERRIEQGTPSLAPYIELPSTVYHARTHSSEQTVLCVDVGGTRIKAGLIQSVASIEDLRQVQTYVLESRPYLEGTPLSSLFRRDDTSPLFSHFKDAVYSGVAVAITGQVSGQGVYSGIYEHPDLPSRCAEEAGCDFTMRNDAVCWAVGALEYQRLRGQEVRFPCLAITLGTGVGVALCRSEHEVADLELNWILDDAPFPRLKACTEGQPFPYWSPHGALGKEYFDWMCNEQPFTDADVELHLEDYNRRFQIFIEELVEFTQKKLEIVPASILVGGGNSRLIRATEGGGPIVLSPQILAQDGISPDVLQLLGARIAMRDRLLPSFIPSYEEVLEKTHAREEEG